MYDGKLVYAKEVERISRLKHNFVATDKERLYPTFAYFVPALIQARKYLLKNYSIDIASSDIVAVSFDFNVFFNEAHLRRTVKPFENRNAKCYFNYKAMFEEAIEEGIDTFDRQIYGVLRIANITKKRLGQIDIDKNEEWLRELSSKLRTDRDPFLYSYLGRRYLYLILAHLIVCKLSSRNLAVNIAKTLSKVLRKLVGPRTLPEVLPSAVEDVTEGCRGIVDTIGESIELLLLNKLMCNPLSNYRHLYNALRRIHLLSQPSINLQFERLVKKVWKLAFGSEPKRIVLVPHHLAHVASAYYTSGMKKALGITIDGTGEMSSTTVWLIDDGEFEPIRIFPTVSYSLGGYYEVLSVLIGFDATEGPGKVMGLAPYGKPNEKYLNLVNRFLEVYDEDSEVPYVLTYPSFDALMFLWSSKVDWDPKAKPLNRDAADFAYAIQKRFEEAYLTLMRWAVRQTGVKDAVIAGGAALNAKANMEVLYSKIFNDLFVFPAANDAGTAIGAALWAYEHVLGGKVKNERIEDVYWGADYSEEVEEAVKWAKETFNLKVERAEITELVDHLLRNEIVTVYQGRPEFGPRALGHRSIVADPRIKENWERVNALKGREWWRPLAPSLLLDYAKEYFELGEHLPFMIVMERFKEEYCKEFPVVCHVDRTARPQTVTPSIDKNWYQLIKAFGDETGAYVVMNTSFNLGGEPLVDTPKQAIVSFLLGRFDAMWMEGYLLRRR